MKNVFSSLKMSAVAMVLGILVFSSCRKSTNDLPSTPAAGLMAFNLVPDKRAGVSIGLSGSALTPVPLSFSGYTGGYLAVLPNSYVIQAFDGGGYASPLTSSNTYYEANKFYSIFVTGANGVYGNVVTVDNFDSLSTSDGKAYVRYVNAIPDPSNPRVTITANGATVSNNTAHYQTVSAFTPVTPGAVAINISNDGNISANRTITVEAQKAYTVLLVGLPGSTDSVGAVQIRFIQNGTLKP